MNVINSSRPMIRSLLLTRSVTPLLVRSYATAGTTEKSAAEKVSHLATGVADHAVMAVKFATDTVGGALGSYKEPIVYNSQVAVELLKQVYVAEKLSPPSLADVTTAYSSFFTHAQQPSYWSNLYTSGEWKKWALYAVEAYGIFKIGEMIGRVHVVGYGLNEAKPVVAHV